MADIVEEGNPQGTLDILTETRRLLTTLPTGNPTADTSFNGSLGRLDEQLDRVETTVDQAIEDNAEMLLSQKQVKNIVETENARINKNIMDTESDLLTKKREILMNDNKHLRTQQYNRLLIKISAYLTLVIVIVLIYRYIPIIPEFIIVLAIIFVAGLGIIEIISSYFVILSRSKVDFNKLALERPQSINEKENEKAREEAKKSGNLLGSIDTSLCSGSKCCGESTIWDEVDKKCIPVIEDDSNEEFSNFIPNNASEINDYSKI